jgi:hypothetical protein
MALADEAPDDDFGRARELGCDHVLGIRMAAPPPEARVRSAIGRHRKIYAHRCVLKAAIFRRRELTRDAVGIRLNLIC